MAILSLNVVSLVFEMFLQLPSGYSLQFRIKNKQTKQTIPCVLNHGIKSKSITACPIIVYHSFLAI